MADKTIVIKSLCRLIETGDEVDRCYVVRTLGVLGAREVIPTLVDCLRDEDIDVSIDAAEALGRLGHPDAIPALLESLKHDSNAEVKITVVEALSKIGGQDIIAPLLDIATQCPDDMLWDTSGDWNNWWDMQLSAVETLGRLHVVKAVPILKAILEDEESQDIESEVLKALALMGTDGEQVLLTRLSKGNPRERRRAAVALGFSQGVKTRKALARALMDQKTEVRIAAIQSLGKQDASPYLEIMLRFLNDPEPKMRYAALEVTHIFLKRVALLQETLIPLLSDVNPTIRATILTLLVGPFSPENLEKIRHYLNDSDDSVISAACLLLAKQGDARVVMTLLQILSDQKRGVQLRCQVATALGILGNAESVNILAWAMKDPAQSVRLSALNALMQLEKNPLFQALPKQATPLEIIISAAKSDIVSPSIESPSVKQTDNDTVIPVAQPALSTLEAIAMDATVPIKETTIDEISPEIQEYLEIAENNIELGERLFVQKPENIAVEIRHSSVRILGDSDHAVNALIDILTDHDLLLRQEAIHSLGEIARRSPKQMTLTHAIAPLLNQLDIETCRLATVRTLGLLGHQTVIPKLLNYLQDENSHVRIETIHALQALKAKPTDMVTALLKLVYDNDFGVRKAAAFALATLGYTPAIVSIIDTVFMNDGAIARDMGQALRLLDVDDSSTQLLTRLAQCTDSSQRRFVIEMLEELFLTRQ